MARTICMDVEHVQLMERCEKKNIECKPRKEIHFLFVKTQFCPLFNEKRECYI